MKIIHLVIIVVSFTMIFCIHNAFAQYGCPPEGSKSGYSQIVTNENHVYVIWDFHTCFTDSVSFVASNNSGLSFNKPIILSGYPAVTALNKNVYLAWTQGGSSLFFKKSINNGATFEDAVSIDNNGTILDSVSKVFVHDDKVGILWSGDSKQGEQSRVFLSESFDGGKSFESAKVLSTTAGGFYPKAVQENNKAYVFWSLSGNCAIFPGYPLCPSHLYFTTIDLENNFFIAPITSFGQIDKPSLAVSGKNIYIVGVSKSSENTSNGTEIIFLKSIDDGINFDKPVVLSSYDIEYHHRALALDASGKNVYVTWYNFHPDTGNSIEMISSTDYGNIFENKQTLDSKDPYLKGSYGLFELRTSASDDNFYSIWQSEGNFTRLNQDLFFKRISDGGKTIADTVDLSNKIQIAEQFPTIISNGNFIYIAGSFTGNTNDIGFSRSTDSGNTFSNSIDLGQNMPLTVPEFPFTISILLVSIIALIIFYRIGSRWIGIC